MKSYNTVKKILYPSLLLLYSWPIFAQTQSRLIYDRKASMISGAENLYTIHSMLNYGFDQAIPCKLFDEKNRAKKVAGISYRFTKLALLDFQMDYLIILAQHEIFGHGSRYREFGYTENSFHLSLPFPLGSGHGYARTGKPEPGRNSTATERIMRITGGNEANGVFAGLFESRMLQHGEMHYRDALTYLLAKNNLTAYIGFEKYKNWKGMYYYGDISSYLLEINSEFAGSEKYLSLDVVMKQSLVSFLNPIQLYAAYAMAKTYLLDGENVLKRIPAIRLGKTQYIPALNYALTPFGSEYSMDNYLYSDKRFSRLRIGVGDNRFCNFYCAGLYMLKLVSAKNFNLDGMIDGWYQPSFMTGGKNVNRVKEGPGFSLKTAINIFPFRPKSELGFYLLAGYKTAGYLADEKLDEGIILRFGVSMKIGTRPEN